MNLWTQLANAVSRWLNFEPKPPVWPEGSVLEKYAKVLPLPAVNTGIINFRRSVPFQVEGDYECYVTEWPDVIHDEVPAKAPRKPRKAITKKAVGRSPKPAKRSQKAPVKAKRASSRKASKSKAKGRKKT